MMVPPRKFLKILAISVVSLFLIVEVSYDKGKTEEQSAWDRLGRTLFGRHEDFWDLHMGKISSEEFQRREKARETAWKATPLALSPLSMHPYMGTSIGDVARVIEGSGVYDKGSKGPGKGLGGIDLSSIHLNYISVIDNPEFSYCSFLLNAKKAKESHAGVNATDAIGGSLEFFLIGLSIPNYKFWVNLNKWEPDRIVDKELEKTEVGRILLMADLRMKKDLARFTHPQTGLGKRYWNLMYKKAQELMPGRDVQAIALTRFWIIPGDIQIYKSDNEVYIIKAPLDVRSEQEYFAYRGIETKTTSSPAQKKMQSYSAQLMKEMILPLLINEVNYGEGYADLRNVYHSLILAQWYKQKSRLKQAMFSALVDRGNGVRYKSKKTWSAREIWQRYVYSLDHGEYNLQEETTETKGRYIVTHIKQYFSGGVDFTDIKMTRVKEINEATRDSILKAISGSLAPEQTLLLYDFYIPR